MVIATYIILMLIFLVMSALILRHTVKYSYLSTRFKIVVSVFGLLALAVFIFSIFLIFQLDGDSKSPSFSPPATPSPSNTEINF